MSSPRRRRLRPVPAGIFLSLLAVVAVVAVVAVGCGERPPDGVVDTGWAPGREPTRHPRIAGRLTPRSTGVQLWYERLGRPQRGTVVLLNGGDSQAIYWPLDFVLRLADEGYEVVRYDPRDVGLSEWLPFPDGFDPFGWTPDQPPPYPLEANVADLWGLLDGLGIPRAHLVGVSQGGMVAQLAALDGPERVASLTLLSSSPSNPYDQALGSVGPELLGYLREQAPRVGRAASLPFVPGCRVVELQTDLLAHVSGVSREDLTALRAHVEASYERAGLNGASAQGFAVASAPSRTDRLGRIRAPTLILHGRHDPFLLPSHALALERGISGARLIWTDGGHGFPFRMFALHTEAMLENFERAAASASEISPRPVNQT